MQDASPRFWPGVLGPALFPSIRFAVAKTSPVITSWKFERN